MLRTFQEGAKVVYLLFWLPVSVLLWLLLFLQGISAFSVTLVVVLFVLPMALVGDRLRYLCRVTSLRREHILLSALRLSGVSVLISGLWTLLFVAAGFLLRWIPDGQMLELGVFLFLIGLLSVGLSFVFHYLVNAMTVAREAEQQAEAAHLLFREAELRTLRSQLNPHFLFNSLNSVVALMSLRPEAAREMLLRLSSYFRTTLALGKQETCTLGDELALLQDYLAIEKVRFGDRLAFTETVDSAMRNLRWPPLLLQPIVENAIKHGVSSTSDATPVTLTVSRDGETGWVSVVNRYDPQGRSTPGTGTGLVFVAERLRRFFGERATLRVEGRDGEFCVSIVLEMEG